MNQGYQNPDYVEITNDQIYNNNNLTVSQDIRRSLLPDEGFAAEANPLIAKKGSNHVRSFFANFIFLSGLSTVLALYFTQVMVVSPGALAGICVGIYLFYLLLAMCSNPLLSYLRNINHGSNF